MFFPDLGVLYFLGWRVAEQPALQPRALPRSARVQMHSRPCALLACPGRASQLPAQCAQLALHHGRAPAHRFPQSFHLRARSREGWVRVSTVMRLTRNTVITRTPGMLSRSNVVTGSVCSVRRVRRVPVDCGGFEWLAGWGGHSCSLKGGRTR